MTVLITMAGAGSRFAAQGYTVPKFQITARGKTLFEWSLLSMRAFFDQPFILVCLASHDRTWIEARAKSVGLSRFQVISRTAMSLGQAQTAYDALHAADPHQPLWIYNIDTHVESGLSPEWQPHIAGYIPVFESTNPGMSFVRYGDHDDDHVIEIAEKKPISRWATIGAYGFKTAALYQNLYEEAYWAKKIDTVKGEHYIAPMYQLLLRAGQSLRAPRLRSDAVHVLGTPQEVLAFDPLARPPAGA